LSGGLKRKDKKEFPAVLIYFAETEEDCSTKLETLFFAGAARHDWSF